MQNELKTDLKSFGLSAHVSAPWMLKSLASALYKKELQLQNGRDLGVALKEDAKFRQIRRLRVHADALVRGMDEIQSLQIALNT
jgi:hypothetical protein